MREPFLRLSWRLGLLLASLATISPAQEEAAPGTDADDTPIRAAKIKSPVPLDTRVDPIAGQWSATEVVLSLVIDQDGHVTSAKVVSGSEPFSGAALRATSNWKFSPAMREDRK